MRRPRQWLTFLARHLERRQSRDFAWWQLPHVIPRPVQGLLFGLPAALLFALSGEMAGGYLVAAVYGVSFALAGCIANALGRRPGPLRVEIRFRGTAVRFLSRFGIGLAIGLGLGLAWSLPSGLIVVLVLVFGLALSVQVWLDIPADANRVSSPLTVLRQDRAAALAFTSSFALSVGTFYGVADAFAGPTQFILVFGGHFDPGLALATGLAGALLGRFAFGRLGGWPTGSRRPRPAGWCSRPPAAPPPGLRPAPSSGWLSGSASLCPAPGDPSCSAWPGSRCADRRRCGWHGSWTTLTGEACYGRPVRCTSSVMRACRIASQTT